MQAIKKYTDGNMTTFETATPSLSSSLESYKHHHGMKIWIPKYGFHKYEKNGLFLRTLGNLVWIPILQPLSPFCSLTVVARTK